MTTELMMSYGEPNITKKKKINLISIVITDVKLAS